MGIWTTTQEQTHMSEKTILMANEDEEDEKYVFDKGETYFLRRILIWQKWAVVDTETWWTSHVRMSPILQFKKRVYCNICKERLALTYR